MACGCSIVASLGMPVAEVIQQNVEGKLVPMDQPILLANQVIELLNNPELRKKLGAAARRKALLYDQRLTLQSLTKLIEST
jgi:glycosyltransferase involved in cell wall biosynthesis